MSSGMDSGSPDCSLFINLGLVENDMQAKHRNTLIFLHHWVWNCSKGNCICENILQSCCSDWILQVKVRCWKCASQDMQFQLWPPNINWRYNRNYVFNFSIQLQKTCDSFSYLVHTSPSRSELILYCQSLHYLTNNKWSSNISCIKESLQTSRSLGPWFYVGCLHWYLQSSGPNVRQ